MMKESVKDHKNLVKVDKAYVINTDDAAYEAALKRQKKQREIESLTERMDNIESKMDLILTLLQKG